MKIALAIHPIRSDKQITGRQTPLGRTAPTKPEQFSCSNFTHVDDVLSATRVTMNTKAKDLHVSGAVVKIQLERADLLVAAVTQTEPSH